MKDSRKSERRDTFEHWTVTDTETGLLVGMAVDLNRDGLRIHSKEPIKAGTVLLVTMHVDKKIVGVDKVDLEVKCRWCRKTQASHLNAVGLAIVSPSPEYVQIEQKLVDFFSIPA